MAFLIGGIITAAALFVFEPALGNTNAAVAYLKTQSPNPWVTMALVAAGETPNVDHLKSVQSGTAIAIEAPILAIAAAGENPRTFPNTDLVAALLAEFDGTQIGDPALLNDDIFGALALVSAGEPVSSAAVTGSRQFILAHQNADGGWSWGVGAGSDIDMTAMAASSLLAAGVPKTDAAMLNAIAYLKAAQNEDGGFPSSPGGESNAASDAWVISFIRALQENPATWVSGGNNPVLHLQALQKTDGFYAHTTDTTETGFTPTETAYALIALSGKQYPVGIFTPAATDSPTVHYRIEGSSTTVCEGDAKSPNALELIRIVAPGCGFTFDIQETSFGPYLAAINSDRSSGFIGWLYRVNYVMPDVGAADFPLKHGDDVLWYYGDFAWPPLRLSLQANEIPSGGTADTLVEFFNGTIWQPLDTAMVHAGNTPHSTDANGHATFALSDGAWRLWASKEGYVRSTKQTLVVGERKESSIPLGVTVVPAGQDGNGGSGSPGNTVGFSLEVAGGGNLEFGSLEPGNTAERSVRLNNTGSTGIHVETAVNGDDLFRNHLTVNRVSWRSFQTMLPSGSSENEIIGLSIPHGYSAFGVKNGELIFWAAPVGQ